MKIALTVTITLFPILLMGQAQSPNLRVGASTPGTCIAGRDFYFNTATPALLTCTATDTFTAAGAGGGSVTSVATTSPIGGGTITGTGTITCTTCVTSVSALTAHGVVLADGLQVARSLLAGQDGRMLQGHASSDPTWESAITLGNGTASGRIDMIGSSSGIVQIYADNDAGSVSFRLPVTNGTIGQPLLSNQGTGPMTWGTLGVPGGGTGLATITSNALIKGNTTGAMVVSGCLIDSSNNLSCPGTITSGTGSGVAGTIDLTQGTLPGSFPANTASIYSPTSIATSYQWRMPAADAAGAIVSSGAGTPGVLSIVGFSGSGNIAKVASPTFTGTVTAADLTVSGTCTGCGGGGSGSAGSTLFSTTASTTVTVTSATTLIGTVVGSTTIPVNTFTAGQFFEFVAEGYYSTPATPASLTIDLKIGGTTRITTGSVIQIASVTTGTWRLRCGVTTRTAGASGTQIANCVFEATGATITPGESPMQTSSTWTVDTTATNVIDLQATWSTVVGSPTITATNVAAWIPGAPLSPLTVSGVYLTDGSSYYYPPAAMISVTPPAASGWTWDNQGSSVTSTTGNTLYMSLGGTNSDTIQSYNRSVSGTFTVILGFRPILQQDATSPQNGVGITVGDGTKYILFSLSDFLGQASGMSLRNQKWSTTSSASSAYVTINSSPLVTFFSGQVFWEKLVLDSTNLTWSYSFDGANWIQFDQRAKGDFLGTITVVGVGAYNHTSANALVFSWAGA